MDLWVGMVKRWIQELAINGTFVNGMLKASKE
jgi:hypothetical protein